MTAWTGKKRLFQVQDNVAFHGDPECAAIRGKEIVEWDVLELGPPFKYTKGTKGHACFFCCPALGRATVRSARMK